MKPAAPTAIAKPAAPTAIAKPGALIREFKGHSSAVLSVAFSPDGQHILSGSIDYSLRLWNAASTDRITGDAVTTPR
jgi:WD40 repeat protein